MKRPPWPPRPAALLAVALAPALLLAACADFGLIPTQKGVTGQALSAEAARMNRAACDPGPYFYKLDWADDDLIVAHNHLYLTVLEKRDGAWALTALFSPDPAKHFRLQGSTISGVGVDPAARTAAVYPLGIDGEEGPLYLCHFDTGEVETVSDVQLPAGFGRAAPNRVHSRGNGDPPDGEDHPAVYNYHDETLTLYDEAGRETARLALSPEPETSVWLIDEGGTAVYMSSPHWDGAPLANTLGAWRVCFLDTATGRVETLKIE